MELFNNKELMALGERLLGKKETIAAAESVTSGLLQYAFSNIPDASKFFHGGLTAYNLGQKFKHLKVDPIHAQSVNCVSQQVADEMALHVCEQFRSHWGLGITGYATAVPESGGKVFAYYAIAYDGKVKHRGKIAPGKMDPPALQLHYVNFLIHKLYTVVK